MKGKNMTTPQLIGSVTVGERGQMVIPSEAREEMKISAGDKLLVFKAPIENVLIVAKPETFEKLISHIGSKLDGKQDESDKNA